MRKILITVIVLWVCVFGGSARAHELERPHPQNHSLKAIFASQTENLKHARYVCLHGSGYDQWWHCQAKIWLLREWKKSYAKLHPDIRTYVRTRHPCLAGIIDRENKSYDPTLNYGGGHGNVYVPYGIPQANPGTKMASAGKDWRTNPFTQVKWMIHYVSRYGGECPALAYRISHGSY